MSRDPSPELRAAAARLFEACREERPTTELERRVLAQRVAQEEAHSEVRRALLGARRPTTPARWLAAALVLSLGGIGLWLSRDSRPMSVSISAEQRPAEIAQHESPSTHSTQPTVPEPEAPPAVASAPARARPRVKTASPPAPSSTPPPTTTPPEPIAPEPAPPKASFAQDLQNLMHIRVTLRSGDSTTALELLDRRARESGSTELDAEATLLRIEALASAGRHGEASMLAQRFVEQNPNSALADRAKAFAKAVREQ